MIDSKMAALKRKTAAEDSTAAASSSKKACTTTSLASSANALAANGPDDKKADETVGFGTGNDLLVSARVTPATTPRSQRQQHMWTTAERVRLAVLELYFLFEVVPSRTC